MDFSTIVLVFIIILNTGLASLILINNYKSVTNRLFTFLVFSVLIWTISLYFSNFYGIYSLLWTKITFIGAALIAYSLLFFCINFPKKQQTPILFNILIHSVVILIIYFITFTEYIVKDITIIQNGTGVLTGKLYFIWIIFFLSFIASSIILLLRKINKSEENEKKQVKIVGYGFFITAFLGIITNVLLPLLNIDYLAGYGSYSLLIFIGFTSYAIVKYQLMDIKVIATETLVVVINIGLLFNALFADSLIRLAVGWSLFAFGIMTGYLLIKSVLNEIKQKEKLQELTMQLGQANSHLQELDKMKTEFVSLASHELLTPVSAIEGYLSMILDEKLSKVEDPKTQKYLDRVYRSAKRLARLIADMLNISRIEEGRLLVEKKEADLGEIARQVLEELKFKAEEHKQKIVLEIKDEELKTGKKAPCFVDVDKIKEVMVNIIGNSIKYSQRPGTITVSLSKISTTEATETWDKIEQIAKAQPLDDQESMKAVGDERLKKIVGSEQYLIEVKDQGIGIPKEEIPRLFKKFHRVGNFSTQESQGTGLGLYISRALIELNHGRIWGDSEGTGKGSTFSFFIPTIEAKSEIEGLEEAVPEKGDMKPLAKPMGDELEEI